VIDYVVFKTAAKVAIGLLPVSANDRSGLHVLKDDRLCSRTKLSYIECSATAHA